MVFNIIVKKMHEFQKEHNITKCCVTNTQYLYDMLNGNGYPGGVTAKAVIMTTIKNNEAMVWGGHLVVSLGGKDLCDPSYETHIQPNQQYFDNINDLLLSFPTLKQNKELLIETIQKLLEFNKIAKRINSNELVITDKDFYNKQADYIERAIRKGIE